MSEKDSGLKSKCKEIIKRIVKEIKVHYPERKEILYADVIDYIRGIEELVTDEMDIVRGEIFDTYTNEEISSVLGFCNRHMTEEIYSVENNIDQRSFKARDEQI